MSEVVLRDLRQTFDRNLIYHDIHSGDFELDTRGYEENTDNTDTDTQERAATMHTTGRPAYADAAG